MCGIAGAISAKTNSESLRNLVENMCSSISYRGPDASGIWQDNSSGVVFGHQRLSILDLSSLGAQPMISKSQRYIISFNGEVFNFQELREELRTLGSSFKGNSDTEVMLEAIERWGVESAVKKFVGMFAFALWDKEEKNLYLVRDRLGIKPLYYGFIGDKFCFVSELNGIVGNLKKELTINKEIIPEFISNHFIAAPNSIYKEIFKLPQGTILCLPFADINNLKKNFSPKINSNAKHHPIRYWSLEEIINKGNINPFSGSEKEAEEQVNKLLSETVRLRMISDVPLGAFLSGGIDSSLIVALMKQHSSFVETFSIGFEESAYNEAPYAQAIAKHLETKHHEIYFSAKDAMQIIPQLASMFDEPFADSSQLPTYVICSLAKKNVTVSLSGEGGDELFCGYPRYQYAKRMWNLIKYYPTNISKPLLNLFSLQGLQHKLCQSLPAGSMFDLSEKLFTIFEQGRSVLTASSLAELYDLFNSYWINPNKIFLQKTNFQNSLIEHRCWGMNTSDISKLQFYDMDVYLADDLLTKSDRTSMALGLETRVPFLDHRLVEFIWSLPENLKYRDGKSKWILRKVLERYVPTELFERPKMGFSVPISRWLRGSLKDWAENLLSEESLNKTNIFETKFIRGLWLSHQKSSTDKQNVIWPILMYQAWALKE